MLGWLNFNKQLILPPAGEDEQQLKFTYIVDQNANWKDKLKMERGNCGKIVVES